MNPHNDIVVTLDDRVLERIAQLICGDDGPLYRTGRQLTEFFSAAGWMWVGEVDGPRRPWVYQSLMDRRADSPALHRLLLRLADPREYLDEEVAREKTVEELNQLLAVEGLMVDYRGRQPVLLEAGSAARRFDPSARQTLKVDLADLVNDREFGDQLRTRLDEARLCLEAGAHMAATIMLGSLLEGALYDLALSSIGPSAGDNLQRLIELAKDNGWITTDVYDYADVLRKHRNLVHPKRQWKDSYEPDGDTAHIAFNVVVAALNDLAATRVAREP